MCVHMEICVNAYTNVVALCPHKNVNINKYIDMNEKMSAESLGEMTTMIQRIFWKTQLLLSTTFSWIH